MSIENSVYKNDYVPLNDLVYAPLYAISQSNIQLSSNIIELINLNGEIQKDPQNEDFIRLKTINLSYEQIKNEQGSSQQLEEVELKLPLISILPLSGLQVNNAKVKFNIEISGARKNGDTYDFVAQVSSPNTRKSDNSPKLLYEIELKSTPCPEGLARFIDILNNKQVPIKLASNNIDEDGNIASMSKQNYYNKIKILRKRQNQLDKVSSKLSTYIQEKKLFSNFLNSVKEIPDNDYNGFVGGKEKLLQLIEKNPDYSFSLDLYSKIQKYTKVYSEIQDKLYAVHEQLVIIELENIEEGFDNE